MSCKNISQRFCGSFLAWLDIGLVGHDVAGQCQVGQRLVAPLVPAVQTIEPLLEAIDIGFDGQIGCVLITPEPIVAPVTFIVT